MKCSHCNINFLKANSEISRQAGKFHFCSQRCQFGHRASSPVTEILRHAKRRSFDKGFVTNLTLGYLEDLWAQQKHKCAYTGIPLQLPKRPKGKKYQSTYHDRIFTASLDRTDSNLPYSVGNVRFVSMCVNYMKHTMSHKDTLKMFRLIKKYRK